jgi:hypothetical protein
MVNNGLQFREQAYRSASRTFDYFVTGLSSVLFLATVLTFEVGRRPIRSALEVAAIILFVLAVITGLKKLEYFVAVLGADYSIAMTETNQGNLTMRETSAVLRDLNDTVESLSHRASIVHRLRNWFLVLGLVAMIAPRFFGVIQAF